MKRTISIILLIVSMLMLSLAATQAQDKLTIGLSVPSADAVYYTMITEAELTDMDNVTLNVMDAEYDAETELANVTEMMDAGMDALMLIPVDAEASVATVQAANEAGVPVFLMVSELSYDAEEIELEFAGEFYLDTEAAAATATEFACALFEDEGNVIDVVRSMPEEMTEDTVLTQMQMLSVALGTAMTESCEAANVSQSVIGDVTGDDLFDAIDTALAADSFDVLFGYDSDVITEAINAKFPANRGLSVISFVYSDDVEFFLGVGDVNAAVLADPEVFLQDSLTAAMTILSDEELEEAFVLAPFVLDSEMFATTRCNGPC